MWDDSLMYKKHRMEEELGVCGGVEIGSEKVISLLLYFFEVPLGKAFGNLVLVLMTVGQYL